MKHISIYFKGILKFWRHHEQSQLLTFSTVYRLTVVLYSDGPAVCVNFNKSVLCVQQSKMAGNSR